MLSTGKRAFFIVVGVIAALAGVMKAIYGDWVLAILLILIAISAGAVLYERRSGFEARRKAAGKRS